MTKNQLLHLQLSNRGVDLARHNKHCLNTGRDATRMRGVTCCIHSIMLGVLLIVSTLSVNAQHANFEWAKGVGGAGTDHGYEVAADADGNVYVTGIFTTAANFNPGGSGGALTSGGGIDGFVAKYDPTGNYLWAKRMGGSGDDYGKGVAADADGNVYVTGYFAVAGANFNPGGSGGALTSAGNTDAFVAKYSPSGTFLWAKSMGGTGADFGEKVAVDANGNVYVTGYIAAAGANFGGGTLTSAGGIDAFVAKYDPNGNYLWAKTMGGTGSDYGSGVAVDANGNVYVAGRFPAVGANFNPGGSGGALTSAGGVDVYVAKYDPAGNYLWAKSMGGTGTDEGRRVAADAAGNVYIAGLFAAAGANFNPGGSGGALTSEGGNDAFVAKYDPAGNYLWAKNMGGTGADIGQAVAVDANGNVYVAGQFSATGANFNPGGSGGERTSAGGIDAFVAKYGPNGDYLWAKTMGGTAGSDLGYGVAADADDNVYVTGYFNVAANFNPDGSGGEITAAGDIDVFIARYIQGCTIAVTFTESACDSFAFNGHFYTASGTYLVDTFVSSANCDSIVTLNLTIKGYTSSTVVGGHYCDSVTFNGQTYTATGIYTQNYSNAAGCDSNIIYDLTIGQSNSESVSLTECDSFAFNGMVYTASGIYFATFTNESGCDSVIVLDLTINNSPEGAVVLSETTLSANAAESYQWVDCNQNYAHVPGATDQIFIPNATGSYAVIVTENGCSDTSECLQVAVNDNSVNEPGAGNKIWLYPNPVDSRVTIQTEQALKNATIRLVNVAGQLLSEQAHQHGRSFTLDMSRYAGGVYFVEITEDGKMMRMKMVKE